MKRLPALSKAMRAAGAPLEADELYALPDIGRRAPSISRVSSYLEKLWRKGFLHRSLPTGVKMGDDNWVYSWNENRVQP